MSALNIIYPTLGSEAAAAANTTRIQAMLNSGASAMLGGSGVAYINDSLVISGSFDTGDVELKLAAGTVKPLVVNSAYLANPEAVTLAWSAGREATVTKVAHGLAEGQAVWLRGANQPQYLGVFRIVDVPTADTFVVRLELTPTTSPTGTITMVLADQNMVVKAKVDYDWPNNNDGTASVDSHAVVLVGVDHLDVDIVAKKAFKYGLCVSAVADYRIRALFPETRSDGVKVYGPAFRGEIVGVDGLVGDDLLSFQPLEATAFLNNATSFGPIVGVRGGNIFSRGSTDGGQGALVFYGNAAGYALDDIRMSGVHGQTQFAGVCLTQNNDVASGATALMGTVEVNDITIRAKRPPAYTKQNASGAFLVLERLCLEIQEARTAVDATDNSLGSVFWHSNFCRAKQLHLKMVLADANYGSGGGIWAARIDGSFDTLHINPQISCNASLRAVRLNTQYGTSTAGVGDLIVLKDGAIKADHAVTVVSTALFTNVPEIVFDGMRVECPTGVNAQVSCDVLVRNSVLSGVNLGVVRAQGASVVNLRSTGNVRLGTVNDWVIVSGTPTLNPKSDEVLVDVSSTGILKAQGNRCYNTNAAVGTLGVAGPVIADASVWKLQSDLTKTS
jgi:hypothetical protein